MHRVALGRINTFAACKRWQITRQCLCRHASNERVIPTAGATGKSPGTGTEEGDVIRNSDDGADDQGNIDWNYVLENMGMKFEEEHEVGTEGNDVSGVSDADKEDITYELNLESGNAKISHQEIDCEALTTNPMDEGKLEEWMQAFSSVESTTEKRQTVENDVEATAAVKNGDSCEDEGENPSDTRCGSLEDATVYGSTSCNRLTPNEEPMVFQSLNDIDGSRDERNLETSADETSAVQDGLSVPVDESNDGGKETQHESRRRDKGRRIELSRNIPRRRKKPKERNLALERRAARLQAEIERLATEFWDTRSVVPHRATDMDEVTVSPDLQDVNITWVMDEDVPRTISTDNLSYYTRKFSSSFRAFLARRLHIKYVPKVHLKRVYLSPVGNNNVVPSRSSSPARIGHLELDQVLAKIKKEREHNRT